MTDKKWVMFTALAILVGFAFLFFHWRTFSQQTGYSLLKTAIRDNVSTSTSSASIDHQTTVAQEGEGEKNKTIITSPTGALETTTTTPKFNKYLPNFNLSDLPLQYPHIAEYDDAAELLRVGKKFTAAQPQNLLIILLWTKLFRRADWALGSPLGQAPFKNLQCPVSNCYVTGDRAFLNNASAVLINFRDDFDYKWICAQQKNSPNFKHHCEPFSNRDRPAFRPTKQHWIYFLWESPEHTYDWTWEGNMAAPKYLNNFGGFFNWTMTYRLDSDIPFLYGRFFKKPEPDPKAVAIDRLSKKTKSVIWIQSNCNTRSHRSEFVKELLRHIDVEVVGNCASGPTSELSKGVCSRPGIFEPMKKECLDHISSTFKYYLATENSLCRDYVTEKFFRGASLDLIPVVFNGATMSQFGPPHSYIDAKDYDSPQKLAEFLIELGNDNARYNSYFWWKQYYGAENFWDHDAFKRSFCDLCAKVTRANLEPEKHAKVYDDINDWWMTQGNCYEGKTQF